MPGYTESKEVRLRVLHRHPHAGLRGQPRPAGGVGLPARRTPAAMRRRAITAGGSTAENKITEASVLSQFTYNVQGMT